MHPSVRPPEEGAGQRPLAFEGCAHLLEELPHSGHERDGETPKWSERANHDQYDNRAGGSAPPAKQDLEPPRGRPEKVGAPRC